MGNKVATVTLSFSEVRYGKEQRVAYRAFLGSASNSVLTADLTGATVAPEVWWWQEPPQTSLGAGQGLLGFSAFSAKAPMYRSVLCFLRSY